MGKFENLLKKIFIPLTVSVVSFFLGQRRLKTQNQPVKVNLGCGLLCLPDWINVDGSLTALLGSRWSWWNKLVYRLAGSAAFYSFADFNRIIKTCRLHFYDLRRGAPLADKTADFIFASHFLEHLNEKDGFYFINDCYRALKTGGVLRILVPNLDFAINMYKSGQIDEMLRTFFYTSDRYDFHMHKYNYNFETLKKRLEKAGFRNIRKTGFKEGKCPDIDFLDIYPDYSLIVECRK